MLADTERANQPRIPLVDTQRQVSPLAGKVAPASSLIDVAKLVAAYYSAQPDPTIAAQRVAFGTSGHRGSASAGSFNEWHVLAITQAICNYRKLKGISGPLFMGVDTHALSEPACATALQANDRSSGSTRISAPGRGWSTFERTA